MSQDQQYNISQAHLNLNDEKSCEYDLNANEDPLSVPFNFDAQPIPKNQRRSSLSSINTNKNTTYRRSNKFKIEFERRNMKRAKSINAYNSFASKSIQNTSFVFKNNIINPFNTNYTNANTKTFPEYKDNETETQITLKPNEISLQLPENSSNNNSILTPSKIQSKIIQPFAAKIDAKIHNAPNSTIKEFSFTQNNEKNINIQISSAKEVNNEIKNKKSKQKRKQQIKKRVVNTKKKLIKNESKYERRQRERLESISKKKKTHKNTKNNKQINTNTKQERISKKKKIEQNKEKYEQKQRQKLKSFKAKKTKHLKVKNTNNRKRRKSKSAQEVLNDIKKKKIVSNKRKFIEKHKKYKFDKNPKLTAAEKRTQKLQKAKNQVKCVENKLKIGRNKRKRDVEKAYKERTSQALQSAELKKIELSSAVWNALKQLRPVQRKKIEQEIKRQLKDEKDLMMRMKEDIENTKLKTERESMLIKEKFEREKNLYKKEKEELILERKKIKTESEEIYALRKALEQKKRIMDAELNKNILQMRDTRKRLDKTQQMTQIQRVKLMQQSDQVNMKLKDVKKETEQRCVEVSENTEKLMRRFKDLVCKDMDRLRREKKQILNKKHEIHMKEAEIHNKEEVLHKKKKQFEREKRRLSADLSSHAAKLVAELTGYDDVNQQMQFNEVILKILNNSIEKDRFNGENLILEKIKREKNDLEQKYYQLKQKTVQLEKELKYKAAMPVSVPKLFVVQAPTPSVMNVSRQVAPAPPPLNASIAAPAPVPINKQVNSVNVAPAPPPMNMAPPPMTMAAPAPPPMNGSLPPVPMPAPMAPGSMNIMPSMLLPNIPPLMKKQDVFMGKAPPKDIEMRGIQWKPLKGPVLKETIFNDMKINYQDTELVEFDILDKLWCKPKKNRHKDKKTKKVKDKRNKRTKIEFLSEMDSDGKKGRSANIIINANKKSAEEYRDIILTMQFNEKDKDKTQELVTAIHKIVPNEKHMINFNEYFKTEKYKLFHVKYFGIGERLWYYCRNIPLVSLRCEMWKFKLEFDELCEDQYKHINLLKNTHNGIYKNEGMLKIFELVLVIGNYLNYGHKRNGGAKGIRLDIFDKFRDLKANKQDNIDKYTLLMYLVDMVNKKHSKLCNWINIFDNCNSCAKIKSDELESDVKSIWNKVKQLKINLQKMDQQRIKYEKEQKRKVARKNRKKQKENEIENKEEIWEEPQRPNDVYKKVMTEFLKKAEIESEILMKTFEDTMIKCNNLVMAMGEKLTEKYTLSHFWSALDNIKIYWLEAQKLLKIEHKKSETKKKLVRKLQRRTSKDILEKKGIIKSENDIQKAREKKIKIGQIAIENIIKKKVAAEIQLYGGMNAMLTRHGSIGVAELQYKCQHCGIIKQDVVSIKESIHNEYSHKCYNTPNDIAKKTLKRLPLNMKANNCQFNHTGGCLIIYRENDKKKDELNVNKKKNIVLKKHRTADSFAPKISLLKDIDYNNMNNLQLINHLTDKQYEKHAKDRMVKHLKNPNKFSDDFLDHDYDDNSDSEDEFKPIIYAHQMDKIATRVHTKRKKKVKKQNSARKLYDKHKKNIFTRNPKKKSKKRLSRTSKCNMRVSLEIRDK